MKKNGRNTINSERHLKKLAGRAASTGAILAADRGLILDPRADTAEALANLIFPIFLKIFLAAARQEPEHLQNGKKGAKTSRLILRCNLKNQYSAEKGL